MFWRDRGCGSPPQLQANTQPCGSRAQGHAEPVLACATHLVPAPQQGWCTLHAKGPRTKPNFLQGAAQGPSVMLGLRGQGAGHPPIPQPWSRPFQCGVSVAAAPDPIPDAEVPLPNPVPHLRGSINICCHRDLLAAFPASASPNEMKQETQAPLGKTGRKCLA